MIKATKQSEIQHNWHLVDAKDQTLGRLAVKIALLLVGKSKTNFVRNLDCSDNVVIINAAHVKVTGKKETGKIYTRYSGFPGGITRTSLGKMRATNPTQILKLAVAGMLPNNKLKDRWLTRLHIYADDKHEYTDRFNKN